MADFVGAIDQGTTSSRFMIFDHAGQEVSKYQLEHEQILPRPGWVEHNPLEILDKTYQAIEIVLEDTSLSAGDLAAVGITNQRETTVLWNPETGEPWCNAIVWQDTRNDEFILSLEKDERGQIIREKTGLLPANYFSGGKIRWVFDNIPGVKEAAARGKVLFGNVDSWLIWNLTGGTRGGVHITDVTNASRTMLMDLRSRTWDDQLLEIFGIPREILPEIRPSSQPGGYGMTALSGPFSGGIILSGDLGDQQAATVGQVCFAAGEAKNTYGTGNFMLLNTAEEAVKSHFGLLTTICYQMNEGNPVYALEGSIAVTGSAVQWLRDQLGLIDSAAEVEELALTVEDNGGVYFVPAFSGLFAPYWKSSARGVIVGLSRYANRGHLARATLESICFQTRDVLEAMRNDSGIPLEVIKVDGGPTANNTLMQMQADILGVPVVRPKISETTSLGAAYAAGLAVGFWRDLDDLRSNWNVDRTWEPQWSEDRRNESYLIWKRAVERSFDWIQPN